MTLWPLQFTQQLLDLGRFGVLSLVSVESSNDFAYNWYADIILVMYYNIYKSLFFFDICEITRHVEYIGEIVKGSIYEIAIIVSL